MVGRALMKSDNSKYYEILDVPTNASQEEIRKAYRTAVVSNHPDKGGGIEKFQEIQKAYEVLGDPVRRQEYDGFKDGEGSGVDPMEGFQLWHVKGLDIKQKMEVTLEELFNGTQKTQSIPIKKLCPESKGEDAKCAGCDGTGLKPAGDVYKDCIECRGMGKSLNVEDWCTMCGGKGVVSEEKDLTVCVEVGMQSFDVIILPGEADESPEISIRGDVVFVLEQKEHPKFKREGDNLYVTHSLSLAEALCGFQFVLTHLDSRKLLFKSKPGEVVKPGQVKEIDGEGMPMHQRPGMRGSLYIEFAVVGFPDSLSPEQCNVVEGLMPPPNPLTARELRELERRDLQDVESGEFIFGEDASKQGMGDGGDPPGATLIRKGRDVYYLLEVTLEDLFNGKSKQCSRLRKRLCSICTLVGTCCAVCRGTGAQTIHGHCVVECINCIGIGEIFESNRQCLVCEGKNVFKEKKAVSVKVEKGMSSTQNITFPGEVNEQRGTVYGDLVFVLQQTEHSVFKRKGDDLYVEYTLTLTEALCGFQAVLERLDKTRFLFKPKPGEVVKPGQVKVINGEGMPLLQHPSRRGKLFIRFSVAEFPNSLSQEQCLALEGVLPPKPLMQMTDVELAECQETALHDMMMTIADIKRKHQQQLGDQVVAAAEFDMREIYEHIRGF